MTTNTTHQEFLAELKALLGKYKARIEADDHWEGYAECGRDIRMTVEFDDMSVEDLDLRSCVDAD